MSSDGDERVLVTMGGYRAVMISTVFLIVGAKSLASASENARDCEELLELMSVVLSDLAQRGSNGSRSTVYRLSINKRQAWLMVRAVCIVQAEPFCRAVLRERFYKHASRIFGKFNVLSAPPGHFDRMLIDSCTIPYEPFLKGGG